MNSVIYILRDERDRLETLVRVYKKKIGEYPQGRIAFRGRGRAYAYLVRTINGKERQKYLGPADSSEVVAAKEAIRQRKAYESRIEQAMKESKLIRRMLRVS